MIHNRIERIVTLLLVIPMFLRWIMPSAMEGLLYIHIADISLWFPDICYILYIIYYHKLHISYVVPKRNILNIVLFLILVYAFLMLFVSPSSFSDKINILISNFSFIYLPWLYINYPLDGKHIKLLKWPLTIALLFIAFQVILYGTNILNYTSSTGNDLTEDVYDMAGVFRISTTVGAATGTGVLLVMLGILVICYYSFSKWMFVTIFVVNTIAILFTISRGPIMSWLIFCSYYFLWTFVNGSWRRKFLYLVAAMSFLYAVDTFGLLNPLKVRLEYKESNVTSGRSVFNREALLTAERSGYFGVGSGLVFPEKSIASHISTPYYIRMHNTYLVYLAELGLVGFVFYILFYYLLIINIRIKTNLLGIPILTIFLINYNTEALFVWTEYLSLMMLIMLSGFSINNRAIRPKY